MASKTVVVVDDDQDALDLISFTLEQLAIRVLKATNASDCLGIIQREGVDLIITDISMPEINGLQLIKIIRKMDGYENVPVVLLSAGVSPISFQDYQFKANAFCLKQRLEQQFLPQVSGLLELN
jgi:CheY-like chemotaxis protein